MGASVTARRETQRLMCGVIGQIEVLKRQHERGELALTDLELTVGLWDIMQAVTALRKDKSDHEDPVLGHH